MSITNNVKFFWRRQLARFSLPTMDAVRKFLFMNSDTLSEDRGAYVPQRLSIVLVGYEVFSPSHMNGTPQNRMEAFVLNICCSPSNRMASLCSLKFVCFVLAVDNNKVTKYYKQ